MAARRALVQVAGEMTEVADADRLVNHLFSASFTTVVALTQVAYDALDPGPDANTLYLIDGSNHGVITADMDFNDFKAKNVTLANYQESVAADTNVATSATIPDTGNVVRYTLTGNATITLPTADELPDNTARALAIVIKQDATGSRTLTLAAPSGYSLIWNNAVSQPEVHPGIGKTTIYSATYFEGDTNIYASLSFYEG